MDGIFCALLMQEEILSLALNSKIKQTATESYLKMPMHRRLAKKDKLTEHRIQLGHTHRRRSIMT